MRAYRLRIPLEGPYPARVPSPVTWSVRFFAYSVVAVLLTVSGCASHFGTAPEDEALGVRDGIERVEIRSVAVAYIGSDGSFGLSEADLTAMIAIYEDRTVRRLRDAKLQVLTRESVAKAVEGTSLAGTLDERLNIDRSLSEIFETAAPSPGIDDERVEAVRELGRTLGVDAIFLGQVVYHTTAQCDATTYSGYTPFVAHEGSPPKGERVPCAISHYEAKLLDATNGRTIWYNRALRELRAAREDAPVPDLVKNANATVDLVVWDGPAGFQVVVSR